MIAAEQFRRRLMANNRMDIDCGYVTITVKLPYSSGPLRLTHGTFGVGKISAIYINNEVTPVTDVINVTSGTTIIRVHYRNLDKCDDMFANLRVITSTSYETVDIDVSMLNTSTATSFERMFSQDYGIVTGLSNLDISMATSLKDIFNNCRSDNEESVWSDIKNWNTSNVKDFSGAFKEIEYGEIRTDAKVDISGWDTSKAITMKEMFYDANINEIKMMGKTNPQADTTDMFYGLGGSGKFYYNPQYDYSHIIAQLPSTWTAIPVTQ